MELKKGEHVLKLLITGEYLNVDWIKFEDPNNPLKLAREIRLAPQQNASYNVFGATGKFLGRIDNVGTNLSATLKQAGYASGAYIVRGIGHSKAMRVTVK